MEDRMFGAKIDTDHRNWKVALLRARTAWETRAFGQSKIYVQVYEADGGTPVNGIRVRFEVMPTIGLAYKHDLIYGPTGKRGNLEGYLEYQYRTVHPQGAVYSVYIGDSEEPVIVDLNTRNVPYEYPIPPGSNTPTSYRPTVGPGMVSYDITIVRKNDE